MASIQLSNRLTILFSFASHPHPLSHCLTFFAYDLNDVFSVTKPLGIPWHNISKKGQDFAPHFDYVGFSWNIIKRSVTVPDEKRLRAIAKPRYILSASTHSQRDVASIHGTLQHLTFIYRDGHHTLSSITNFSPTFQTTSSDITSRTTPAQTSYGVSHSHAHTLWRRRSGGDALVCTRWRSSGGQRSGATRVHVSSTSNDVFGPWGESLDASNARSTTSKPSKLPGSRPATFPGYMTRHRPVTRRTSFRSPQDRPKPPERHPTAVSRLRDRRTRRLDPNRGPPPRNTSPAAFPAS